MINRINFITIFLLSIMVLMYSCKKGENYEKTDFEYKDLETDIEIKGNGDCEKIITKPLVRIDGCNFIVEGTIEFHKNDIVVAIVDFGDGTCDNIATKTVDGITTEFILKKKGHHGNKQNYDKVVIEPIVKLDNCDYIVSGVVEFYEGDKWLATIDFGDGTCDEWATKIWDGGSKTFSMNKD